MTETIRVGAVCTVVPGHHSGAEQLMGAQFARAYTTESWPGDAPSLELFQREVVDDPAAAESAARELVEAFGCTAIMSLSGAQVATHLAGWCDKQGLLSMAANNNPVIREGRKRAFGIGVPSEVTGEAVAKALQEVLASARVFLIHRAGKLETYGARCATGSMAMRGLHIEQGEIGDESANRALIERILAWDPDAVYFFAGTTPAEPAAFMRLAYASGVWPPTLFSRSMLCRELRELCGPAAEGHFFLDLYIREFARISAEERALLLRLGFYADDRIVPTANHAFGWDGFRLVAEALRAGGADPDAQVAYIEGLTDYEGVTGRLTFGPDDHNGHFRNDPTTIARLVEGRFIPFNSMGR